MDEDSGCDRLINLFRSRNRAIRVRAAKVLMNRRRDTSLDILLEILDELHGDGLGASVQRILLRRCEPELADAMVNRLRSPAPFVREVACNWLGGRGRSDVTGLLLKALEDKSLMVRRAAGLALANLRDPSSIPRLLACYRASEHDNINVRVAMERALDEMGVDYTKHR